MRGVSMAAAAEGANAGKVLPKIACRSRSSFAAERGALVWAVGPGWARA